ncbi:MAG: hypothetical protein U1E17_05025 [Geminicoccaceae bacterium]
MVWLFLFVWVYWWGGTIHFTTGPVGGPCPHHRPSWRA